MIPPGSTQFAFEVMRWGQYPPASGEATIATLLKGAGYATAAIGKRGLGPVGCEGDPANHGFDLFFGYMIDPHHRLCSFRAAGFAAPIRIGYHFMKGV